MRTTRALSGGLAFLIAAAIPLSGRGADESAIRVYAAGSLTQAMTAIGEAFTRSGGPPVALVFGASGLLRERIERGEQAAVFASADVDHPQALAKAGKAAPPIVFARNRLCALVAPGIEATSETLLDRLLDPAIVLGTSTPKADPSGDYAWTLFGRADAVRPGAYAMLDAKAQKLTGGPGSPQAAPGHSIYAALIAERKADIFLTYCTSAGQAVREVPGSRVVAIPDALAVGATYALAVVEPRRPGAERFALFVLSLPGQEILEQHGFTPVARP
jgi:molybdenum ABC transporter molybdate-binding protein